MKLSVQVLTSLCTFVLLNGVYDNRGGSPELKAVLLRGV